MDMDTRTVTVCAWGCAGARRDIAKQRKIMRLNRSGAP